MKDGYETLTTTQWIPPPWYEYFPLDFAAENFVPGQIGDQRTLDYQLKPQVVVPTDQLLARAEALRRGIQTTTGTRPPPGPAPPVRRPAGLSPPYRPAVFCQFRRPRASAASRYTRCRSKNSRWRTCEPFLRFFVCRDLPVDFFPTRLLVGPGVNEVRPGATGSS